LSRYREPVLGSKLRKFGGEVFVQKTKFALSSRGEKQEIKAARKKITL